MEFNPFQTRSKLYRTPFKSNTSKPQDAFDSSILSSANSSLSSGSSASSSSATSGRSNSSWCRVPSPTSTDLATIPTIPMHQPLVEETPAPRNSHGSQKRARDSEPLASPQFSMSFGGTPDSLVSDERFKPNTRTPQHKHRRRNKPSPPISVASESESEASDRDEDGNERIGSRTNSVWSLSGLSASLPKLPPARKSVVSSVGTDIEDVIEADSDAPNASFASSVASNFGDISDIQSHIESIDRTYKQLYEMKVAAFEAMARKYEQRARRAEEALQASEASREQLTSLEVLGKQKDKKIARLEYDLEDMREMNRTQRRIVDTQSEEITKLRNKISELKLEIRTTPHQTSARSQQPKPAQSQKPPSNIDAPKPNEKTQAKEHGAGSKKEKAATKPLRVALKERDTNKAQEFANRARQHLKQKGESEVQVEEQKPKEDTRDVSTQENQPQAVEKPKKVDTKRVKPRVLPREIEDLTREEASPIEVLEDGINWSQLASTGKLSTLKVAQLDKYLRRHGLSKSGKKAVKIERITTYLREKSA